jgi:mannose-6-phosphate isomerase-like protein (cupin superfamily)
MEKIFELERLVAKLEKEGNYFLDFVNLHTLQVGILRLRPLEKDMQEPHSADEIYFVIRGNGFIEMNNKKHKIIPNSFIYVPANMEHRFVGNTEELLVAYFLTNQTNAC